MLALSSGRDGLENGSKLRALQTLREGDAKTTGVPGDSWGGKLTFSLPAYAPACFILT